MSMTLWHLKGVAWMSSQMVISMTSRHGAWEVLVMLDCLELLCFRGVFHCADLHALDSSRMRFDDR
eukprot:2529635-Amphidinium_carterae.1